MITKTTSEDTSDGEFKFSNLRYKQLQGKRVETCPALDRTDSTPHIVSFELKGKGDRLKIMRKEFFDFRAKKFQDVTSCSSGSEVMILSRIL